MTALAKLHRTELRQRARDNDPHQRARFGRLVMEVETARLWLREAARRACLEDGPADEIVATVNLARLAVEGMGATREWLIRFRRRRCGSSA